MMIHDSIDGDDDDDGGRRRRRRAYLYEDQ
jgi:hypothetical protein